MTTEVQPQPRGGFVAHYLAGVFPMSQLLAERIRHREQVERDYERYRQLVCLSLQAAAAAWAAEHPREAWGASDST